MVRKATTKSLIFNEKYHDNCHDYLKTIYLEKYAVTKYKPILYEIKNNIPLLHICNETPYELYIDVVVCDQHALVFGHHLDINPILATYALNACIGLLMYVPELKIGALAHIDGLPGYSKQSAIDDGVEITFDPVTENLKLILAGLKSMANKTSILEIDFYLVGGIFDLSEVMINDIVRTINKFNNRLYRFTFKGRNLLGPENQSRNICMDMRTGDITYFDYVANSEFYKKHVNKDNLPMNIIKAPRQSEAFLDITYQPTFIN